ncbi:MAG: heavy-metal-associated domain-containing protein [Oscillospiraceae bacterium]
MTTGIIISVLIVVCFIAVRTYVKKLAHGCCGAGGDKERKLTKTVDFSEYKFRYTVKIGGMSCKNCAVRIENALNRQEGIFARVDFKSGAAEVSAKEPLSEFVIRQTVIGLGYSVEEVKQNEL